MDFSDVCGVMGIYAIRIQDYIYIGQAQDMYIRWSGHISMLRRNKHCNNFMQNVYNKYGESALSFSIIDETSVSDLTPSEQWYLDTLKMFHPNDKILNLAPVAGSNLGTRRSDATRAKMRAAMLGKNLGVKLSAEHRAKIRAANLGNTSRVKTYDIIFLAPDGVQHGPITNLAAFAREHGLHHSRVYSVVSGKAKSCNGWCLVTV